jgi:hypothetical protein
VLKAEIKGKNGYTGAVKKDTLVGYGGKNTGRTNTN